MNLTLGRILFTVIMVVVLVVVDVTIIVILPDTLL